MSKGVPPELRWLSTSLATRRRDGSSRSVKRSAAPAGWPGRAAGTVHSTTPRPWMRRKSSLSRTSKSTSLPGRRGESSRNIPLAEMCGE